MNSVDINRSAYSFTTNKADRWLKWMLWAFGLPAAFALVPLVMPRSWMAQVHEAIGMGAFPHQPIAEYLARYASALSAFYGFVLLILATDVRRYGPVIRFQAIFVAVLAFVGAPFGIRAGMPAWWMIGDIFSCCSFGLAVLFLQRLSAKLDGSQVRR